MTRTRRSPWAAATVTVANATATAAVNARASGRFQDLINWLLPVVTQQIAGSDASPCLPRGPGPGTELTPSAAHRRYRQAPSRVEPERPATSAAEVRVVPLLPACFHVGVSGRRAAGA